MKINNLKYQTGLLNDLRNRFVKEKDLKEKKRLKKIGISRKSLLEHEYNAYRIFLYKECSYDKFCRIVISALIQIP